MSDNVLQALGRIEGKVDQIIESATEHRDDDKRRFSEVYGTLNEHAAEINKAKGAKAALLWAVGAVAGLFGAAAALGAKALGWH